MNQEDYCLYLKQALKNLHASKSLAFNVEMELKRLLRIYSLEEIKKL